MKREISLARIARVALLLNLISLACFVSVRAQVRPFVDCVERVDASNYRAYFGYVNLNSQPTTLIINSPGNFFTPIPDPQGQPEIFQPGVHHRVAVIELPINVSETWFLGGAYVNSFFKPEMLCGADGSNSRTFTYQGRLTDANATTNGAYDLRFQLFNAATGGAAQTATLDIENVSVTNGFFTVSLDFGLTPAILDGANTFVEISVRAGTSTGAYTTLSPRQPITAVPLAMRANTANNAFRAAFADKGNDNFRVIGDAFVDCFNFNCNNGGGNLTVGRNLTVYGTINGTASNAASLGGVAANQFIQTNDSRLSDARTPTAGSNNYIQNSTTQQTSANFNIGGSGTLGGSLTANTVNANSSNANVFQGTSSSAVGTRLALQNTTNGGTTWNVISTGDANGEGAGKLIFFNEGSNTAPLQLNSSGANVIGDLTVSGAISGATKNFKIDHPLDPQNKYLNYTSVESPDMMNIYNGNVTTDANGDAIVTMPNYFEALNRDFRYQLTVIGQFAQAIVAEKINGNQFKIKTDKPNVEVSWQVTGIRHDKFAEDNRPKIEETKSGENKGRCLYAPACENQQK